MLKLATLLDNLGEPPADSRYRDPRELAALGYTGVVLYQTTGISGIESLDQIPPGEVRRWVEQQIDLLTRTIDDIAAAGLEPYITYDVLSVARSLVDLAPQQYTCKSRFAHICPASEAALDCSSRGLGSLLRRWPKVAGVVLRFGDNDAARLPYLAGNDIYLPHCPRCSVLGRMDRISLVLHRFYDLVVEQQGRRLIARAWNLRPKGMHDSVELCERLRDRLPGTGKADDHRFILSYKFTETDFWRHQKWNPASLVFGDRPVLYELQCQREFEGKGGVPNWQVPLWRDGPPEIEPGAEGMQRGGLARVSQKVNLAGLWAWVRGGGWGGPFVKNEAWIDANVVAVPKLADNPAADPGTLADLWIKDRLGIADPRAAAALRQTLQNSPQHALHGFYIGPYARNRPEPWHPNGDWIQDDLVDPRAAFRMIQRLREAQLDEVLREKQAAVDGIVACRRGLEMAQSDATRAPLEPLINSLIYGQSLFESLRDLIAGLIAYRRYQKSRDPAMGAMVRKSLTSSQAAWTLHTQRHCSLPGAATAFREEHFWDMTQNLISDAAGETARL